MGEVSVYFTLSVSGPDTLFLYYLHVCGQGIVSKGKGVYKSSAH